MAESQSSRGRAQELNTVNSHREFPRVSLRPSTTHSYVHIAAEIDEPITSRLPIYLFDSSVKRRLIVDCKDLCARLEADETVLDATVFKALIIPPGRGEYLSETEQDVHIARFDVAILIEVVDKNAFERLLEDEVYLRLEERVKEAASFNHIVTASNVKRIDSVDHDSNGVFLFNYFFAEDTGQNIAVWEYTAGWFESETGLDNSTLLLPDDSELSQYALINHCRWDSLLDLLPALLFDNTFEEYVLENFEANRVAAMPILYKLA